MFGVCQSIEQVWFGEGVCSPGAILAEVTMGLYDVPLVEGLDGPHLQTNGKQLMYFS